MQAEKASHEAIDPCLISSPTENPLVEPTEVPTHTKSMNPSMASSLNQAWSNSGGRNTYSTLGLLSQVGAFVPDSSLHPSVASIQDPIELASTTLCRRQTTLSESGMIQSNQTALYGNSPKPDIQRIQSMMVHRSSLPNAYRPFSNEQALSSEDRLLLTYRAMRQPTYREEDLLNLGKLSSDRVKWKLNEACSNLIRIFVPSHHHAAGFHATGDTCSKPITESVFRSPRKSWFGVVGC